MKRVVVIGGGIAGLTMALQLADRASAADVPLEVIVLEAGPRVGGNIRTEREDGWIIECGPNGWLDNAPATARLVHRLGLDGAVRRADARAAKRYVFRDGRLLPVSAHPLRFLTSPLLTIAGRLRLLLEPFSAGPPGGDESIYDFGRRHIGHEATSVLIDAMVSGVFAGDIRALSLASAFPKMAEMERRHGSLFRAMIAGARERRRAAAEAAKDGPDPRPPSPTASGGPAGPGGTLTSLEGGLDRLVTALAAELGQAVQLGRRVRGIELAARGWSIRMQDEPAALPADAVVLAVPSYAAVPLVEGLDAEMASCLREIPSAGLAVVALGYPSAALGTSPDGFGFLVPRGAGPRILGCLWDSSLFAGRAPSDHVLLRAMIGGAHDPEAVQLDDGELLRIVRADLRLAMGIDAAPSMLRVFRHPHGIAQYTVGHRRRLDHIEQRLRRFPGLWVTGSSYYGVSMNACVANSTEQAAAVWELLRRTV